LVARKLEGRTRETEPFDERIKRSGARVRTRLFRNAQRLGSGIGVGDSGGGDKHTGS
jgi:hypothetical protein